MLSQNVLHTIALYAQRYTYMHGMRLLAYKHAHYQVRCSADESEDCRRQLFTRSYQEVLTNLHARPATILPNQL